MKSSFSELSYAFALTHNLVNYLGLPLLSAPIFPSTAAEGKKGGGYDLKLSLPGVSLFLQFKLSHCMTYASAEEFKSGKFSKKVGKVNEPVYRMYLHPLKTSRQTSLLLKLEKRHNLVYYVAPLFHLPEDLSKNYFKRTVHYESRFIRPSVIKKMPDKNEHFVSFRKNGKPWRFSKDPVELERMDTVEEVKSIIEGRISHNHSAKQSIEGALRSMLEVLREEDNEHENGLGHYFSMMREINIIENSEMPSFQKAQFVARNYFDLELLIFTKDEK